MTYANIDTMTFRKVDTLFPDQIEIGDFISIHNNIVRVIDVMDSENGYVIVHEDEYGETEFTEVPEDLKVGLFIED